MKEGPAIQVLPVGIHEGISDEIYHADCCERPSLSCSLAKTMIGESSRHAYYEHPRLGGMLVPRKPASAVMDYGSLGHKLLLGRGADIEVIDAPDWRTNAAKAARDLAQANGHIAVLKKTHNRALEMKAAIIDELTRLGLLEDFTAAKKEVVIISKDGEIWLRSKSDALIIGPQTARFYDLKISERVNPDIIERHIALMNYDLQDQFYTDNFLRVMPEYAGKVQFIFLFCESLFPFSVVPVTLSGEFQALGKNKLDRAKKTWTLCRSTGQWPGYSSGVITVSPKPWDLAREMEQGIPEFDKPAQEEDDKPPFE